MKSETWSNKIINNLKPSINKIIHIFYQGDGLTAWYMEINGHCVLITAYAAATLIDKFDNQKTVEEYTADQSDVVRTYTTYKFA